MNLDAGEKIELMLVRFDEFLEIGTQANFGEKETTSLIFAAKQDWDKMKDL